jgi:hypothetical protein
MQAPYNRTNPSPRYRELLALYQAAHAKGLPDQNIAAEETFGGQSLGKHASVVRQLIRATGAKTLLDYGAGKGQLYRASGLKIDGEIAPDIRTYWGIEDLHLYDPGHAPYSALPSGAFDGVICTDVLEHVPQEDVPWVLGEIFGYARRFVFANVASYPAHKVLPNGENAHATIQPPQWWRQQIDQVHRVGGVDYFILVEEKRHNKRGLVGKLLGPRRRRSKLTNRADWERLSAP